MDIISKKLANGRFYAYSKGRFWFWDEGHGVWKESHLMTQKYELNREVDKLLTPEDFLADPTFFANQAAVQLPAVMLDALRDAQPCQTVPIEPVQTLPEAPAVTDVAAPGFDYSGLDAQTIDTLHMAENQYTQGKKMAETGLRWMVNAVSMAHDALCGAVVQQLDNGRFAPKDDTFRAWCASIGISKSSAYNLLKVAERFGNIELDGKSILDVQPATLLYEAAKPSAPEEMVQKVTTGEITSGAEYRAILKENQQLRADRVNAMNRAERTAEQLKAKEDELAKAQRDLDHEISRSDELEDEKGRLLRECDAAKKARMAAEERASAAEGQLSAFAVDMQGLTEQNARLKAEKEQTLQRAKTAEEALKHQPVTAVMDEEEVDRRAKKLFEDMTEEEVDKRAADKAWGLADARNTELQEDIDDLKRQLEEAKAASAYDPEADLSIVCSCLKSIEDFWEMAFPAFERLNSEESHSTSDYANAVANTLLRDVARVESEREQRRSKENKA